MRWTSLILLLILFASKAFAQQEAPVSERPIMKQQLLVWQHPEPRAKNRGPYAPKPWGGINIFKGEAATWLADAIERINAPNNPAINNPLITDYISQVGSFVSRYSLSPEVQFRFIVTENEQPLANSIGDGRIFISIGLLRLIETEDELAGVLAHEMAHDSYAHVARTLTRQMTWITGVSKVSSREQTDNAVERLVTIYQKDRLAQATDKIIGLSRLDELKADHQAFYTTYRAGYNPRAILNILKRVEVVSGVTAKAKVRQFVLGSHPINLHRAFAINWEVGFVKVPPQNESYPSEAFNLMKEELEKLAELK